MPKHTLSTDLGTFAIEGVPGSNGGKDLRLVFSPEMLNAMDSEGVILSGPVANALAFLIMDCVVEEGT